MIEPPVALKPATQKWFVATCRRYALLAHQRRLLGAAAALWDRAEQAARTVDELGLVFADSKGHPRPRPEVAIERNARIAFARLLRELGLDTGTRPEEYSRPRKFVTINGRRQKAPGAF